MLNFTSVNTEFTTWLDRELKDRGWTRAELSRRANYSQATLSLVFSGDRPPSMELCNAIAKALELPADLVDRKAGLLPPINEDAPNLAEWVNLYKTASPAEREEMLEYARFKHRRRPAAQGQ